MNSTGEYACTKASRGARWNCDKLPKAGRPRGLKLVGIYTPAHWVTFLQDFSLAAGFAGDKISSSRITIHGFAMQCVDYVASGVAGTSKICTTAQHLLGYVQVASESTSFEITSYSAAPAAALFRLPAGATITAAQERAVSRRGERFAWRVSQWPGPALSPSRVGCFHGNRPRERDIRADVDARQRGGCPRPRRHA